MTVQAASTPLPAHAVTRLREPTKRDGREGEQGVVGDLDEARQDPGGDLAGAGEVDQGEGGDQRATVTRNAARRGPGSTRGLAQAEGQPGREREDRQEAVGGQEVAGKLRQWPVNWHSWPVNAGRRRREAAAVMPRLWSGTP